jgi:hypothetical protein
MSTFSFFQLIFDNYSKTARNPHASAATSYSNRIPADVSLDYSPCANLDQSELTELWQQLQTLKSNPLLFWNNTANRRNEKK